MGRQLFTVTDSFFVSGRGLVLVPGIAPVGHERFKVGDPLLLKRPDGTESIVSIGGLEVLCPNPNCEVVVMLREFGKEDAPIGTEVWSVDTAEASTRGQNEGRSKPVLPPKVAQRLRLGRSVAAEIQPVMPEHRAWVHVEPILDPQLGQMEQPEPGLEPILVSSSEGNALIGFRVRRREIHRRFEECPDDWDLVGLSVDQVHVVKNEEELATLLTTWHVDLDALTLPHNVNDPF